MKVALVCDWLTETGGAEQVLKVLHEMFKDAPIYTSQYRPSPDFPSSLDVRTGWLNRLPRDSRRFIAPLRQHYFKHLDLTGYDLVISVTGCDAKFVKTRPGTHLCYCHVPTQYYWGKYQDYLKNPGFGLLNPLARLALKLLLPHLRKNDLKAARRPDYYITISSYAAREIKKYYKREARIIAPPVRTELFSHLVENSKTKTGKCQTNFGQNQTTKTKKSQTNKSEQKFYSFSTGVENSQNIVRFLENNRGRYYVNISRQVNWKNLDLLIKTCAELKQPLLLVGDGPENKNLKRLAKKLQIAPPPQNIPSEPLIAFLPTLPREALLPLLENAKAFLFPSEEPFGIAPVEALAAGCPVIALKKGGALDYIIEGKNGLFFPSPTVKSLARTLKKFDSSPLKRRRKATISRSAAPFSEAAFREKMLQYIYEITKNS